jgi:hypothetical protein
MQNNTETESIVTRVLDSRWMPCRRKGGLLSFLQRGGRMQFVSGIDTSAGTLPVVINVYPKAETLEMTGSLPERYSGKEWEKMRRILRHRPGDHPSRMPACRAGFVLSREKGLVGYCISRDYAGDGLSEDVVRYCLDQVIRHLGNLRLLMASGVDEQ